jgi:tetratricopeptide (TPR) repeat protein
MGAPSERVVRPFVSSTFRDMHAERDEFVKRVFPRLRKLCESRQVTWGEVDLRWGVTDEQRAEGRVLPICINEIRNCWPFFIGILGERYGWVVPSISQELIEREPSLAGSTERSMTDIEITYGVLANPDRARHALFYMRDPSYVLRLPAHADPADYRAENARAAEKLRALKERIRASGLPVREGYSDPRELGEMVFVDLAAKIDQVYPDGSQPDALDREQVGHQAFADSRLRVYVERPDLERHLGAQAIAEGPSLVVHGAAGSGKSALLAHLAAVTDEGAAEVVTHFVGATATSTDWAAMLLRLAGELERRLDGVVEIDPDPRAAGTTFARALHAASRFRRVVLIIDGLDQLEDRDRALDLGWLFDRFPDRVRVILSTGPGRPLDELRRRGWPTLEVSPLDHSERLAMIDQYLAQYRKRLAPARSRRIAHSGQTSNPLYLKTFLEELRILGDHERLDDFIDHYLDAYTPQQLFELILARYEEDYERDRPGLVAEAMSLLWASRQGLSEAEILDLLGGGDGPLPQAIWAPLRLAGDGSMVSRSGLIDFFHGYIREAVRVRYLHEPALERAAHDRLAVYFARGETGLRAVEELPWQLIWAGRYGRTASVLADPSFLVAAWHIDPIDVKEAWAQVEASSPIRMAAAYGELMGSPERDPVAAHYAADLLTQTGRPREAARGLRLLVAHYRRSGDEKRLQGCVGALATALRDAGSYDESLALHRQVEEWSRTAGDRRSLQASLGNQAVLLRRKGQLQEALVLAREQEGLARDLDDQIALHTSLGTQAAVLQNLGDTGTALLLHGEEERICRRIGDLGGLQVSLFNQGLANRRQGRFDVAADLFEQSEELSRQLGDRAATARCLGQRAKIALVNNDSYAGWTLLKSEERIFRELGVGVQLARCLTTQGALRRDARQLDLALEAFQEAEGLFREGGATEELKWILVNEALILAAYDDELGAERVLDEHESVCRATNDVEGLATNQRVRRVGGSS